MPVTATHEGVCECIREPRGKGGMEGYDLRERYTFRRMKRVPGGGTYVRVYHRPDYYETCGPVEFLELFKIISETDQLCDQEQR